MSNKTLSTVWLICAGIILIISFFVKTDLNIAFWSSLVISHVYEANSDRKWKQ